MANQAVLAIEENTPGNATLTLRQATPGKQAAVLQWTLAADADMTIQFRSGGSDIGPPITIQSGQTLQKTIDPTARLRGGTSQPLSVHVTGAGTLSGYAVTDERDP